MKLIQELLDLHEAKGEYNSFKSWKAAIKKKHPDAWIEGDEDIAQAMVGPKPFKKGNTKSVGEWDGAKGELYEAKTEQPKFFDAYKKIAVKHGWKQRADHLHHPLHGTIEVNHHGEWTHLPHGSLRDDDDGFGGSNEANFEKHLKKLSMNEDLHEDGDVVFMKTKIRKEYDPVLKAHGFKKQTDGSWYKTMGCGTVKIDKHGHWEHLDVGNDDNTHEYEGTTYRTLDRHLTSLGM